MITAFVFAILPLNFLFHSVWYHPASWEREIFGNVFQSDKWCEGSLWKEINAWVSDHYGIAIGIRVA